MKVFNGTNKVEHNKPVSDYLQDAYDVNYYWFVSTAALKTGRDWHYDIGLGIKRGDADLYVSVMDGRYPTENDYDYYSDMVGTDFIRISSTDAIFTGSPSPHHWDQNSGVMVVIAVIAQTESVDYSLTIRGPFESTFNFTDIPTNQPVIHDLPYNVSRTNVNPHTYIYRWFNWYSLDFTLAVTQFSGSASYYLNAISEDNVLENSVSGIGVGAENSIWTSTPDMGTVS